MSNRRLRVFTALLAVILFLPGCWSRKEIQELAIVTAMGIDLSEDGSGIAVILQIARPLLAPKPGSEGAGGSPDARPFFFVTIEGRTIGEAILKTMTSRPRRTYMAQLQAVIVGEQAARAGVGELIDYLWRHPEVRPFLDLVVARGKARDLLTGITGQEDITGRGLVNILERGSQVGFARRVQLLDFLYAVKTGGVEPTLPVFAIRQTGTPSTRTAPSVPEMNAEGFVLFRRDRLAAILDQEASRGILWARGEVNATVVTGTPDADSEEHASVRVTGAKSTVTVMPQKRNGLPVLLLRVRADAEFLQRQRLPEPVTGDVEMKVSDMVEKVMRSEVRAALEQTRAVGADAIGFGEMLRWKAPQVWRQVGDRWPERYPDLEVMVEATVTVKRTGILR